jgi:hypothetical protein
VSRPIRFVDLRHALVQSFAGRLHG